MKNQNHKNWMGAGSGAPSLGAPRPRSCEIKQLGGV